MREHVNNILQLLTGRYRSLQRSFRY
jgi:hypothetical protein